MAEVRTLDLGRHEVGYEWRAGKTPPRDPGPGQWLVRKEQTRWVVLFRSIAGADYPIHKFGLTPDGERAAKEMAVKLVDIAWGRFGESTPV